MIINRSIRIGALTISWCLALLPSARADRLEEFKKVEADCNVAEEKFVATHSKKNPTDADFIRNYDDWQVWQFVPQFLALAEANPADDTAFQCCHWIFDHAGSFAGDRVQFAAEQKAWTIIAAHHAAGDRGPELCLVAAQFASPTREQFLRRLLKQPTLSKQHTGYATLALAELITRRMNTAEDFQKLQKRPEDELFNHIRSRFAPDYLKYISDTDIDTTKAETAKLLNAVIDRYGNVPNTISKPYFRDMATLGDKAKQSLYALEHLTIGAEAPAIAGQDLNGHPLKLADYRGRVVLLSFWFSGCGPCMEMVPKEQELVKKFKDRPFTLLAVCSDEDREKGRAAAKEHGIDWPCWFDGDDGPINKNYNINSWPSFYLIDKDGRIADQRMDRDELDVAIEKLLGSTSK